MSVLILMIFILISWYDLQKITSKIWVTNELDIKNYDENLNDHYFSSTILPRIYKNDIKKFNLSSQNVILDDLVFLTSKCEEIEFSLVTVKNLNGLVVTLEKIIEALPGIKSVTYDFEDTDPNIVTSETVKEMIKIPHFLNLKYLDLTDVHERLNLDDFYSYIKKNTQTSIHFEFYVGPISEAYKHRLQEIVNEIVQIEDHGYKIPLITFPGIDQTSCHKLRKLHYHS